MDEEEKLIQRKKKVEAGSNKQVLADYCEDLANYYYKHKHYSNALAEYKEMASLYDDLKQRLKWAICNGKIGDMYMYMEKFDDGIMYVKKYLDETRVLKNVAEEQSALSKLGVIYLFKGEKTTNEVKAKNALKEAEVAFSRSLGLCEQLSGGKKNGRKLMDKRAHLYHNIGLVHMHLGNLETALECINKSIEICTDKSLPECLYKVLHSCYNTKALLYSNKKQDYETALSCLEEALKATAKLKDEDTVVRTCETMSYQADVYCKMSNYVQAKKVLIEAFKLKSPDKVMNKAIKENLQVAIDICNTQEELKRIDPSNHRALKDIYDKLGDGASTLQNYTDAVQYYLMMLKHAKLAGIKEDDKAITPIYVSLYQTYRDLGRYEDAIPYYWKDYELIKDDPKEVHDTMFNLAETLFLAKKPYAQIEQACLKALHAAQVMNNNKLKIRILKRLLTYQRHYYQTDKILDTQSKLIALGYRKFDDLDNSDDEQSPNKTSFATSSIGRDIHLESLSDGNDEPSNNGQEAQNKTETMKKHKKISKEVPTCDSLLVEAENFYKKSDYKSARRVLIKAYKLKTSDKNKKDKIEKTLRTVAEICRTEKTVEATNDSDHATLKDLYEKLGECASYLKNHQDAANYFLGQLQEAEKAGESGKMLIPIYISLYTSYKELGAYDKALPYYEREYELIKDDPGKAFYTMFYMADTLFLAKKPYGQIEETCFKARRAAQVWKNREAEIAVLKKLYKYQEEEFELQKMDDTKKALDELGYMSTNSQEFEEYSSSICDGDIIFGEDICIETLTDYSDSEENVEKSPNNSRRRSSQNGYKLKTNARGETPLHLACIQGNKSQVEELIGNGHPVNVRDHAHWTPLHEACINGFTEIAQILISKGADVNDAKNTEQLTPLQDAARNGHLEVIELLLNSGAKRSVRTASGEKALDFLKQWREKNDLGDDEQILYKRIYNKLKHAHGVQDKNSNQISDPKTPVKQTSDSNQPGPSKSRLIFEEDINSPNISVSARSSPPEDSSSGGEFEASIKENLNIVITNKERKRKHNDNEKSNTNEGNSEKINKTSEPLVKSQYFNKTGTPGKFSSYIKRTARKSTAKVSKTQTQIPPLKPVTVQIEKTSLLIPVKMDTIDKLTIKWLVDEAKSRYCKQTGCRVDLGLMVGDAMISEDDPLSLVHTYTEFKTFITNRNTSNVDDVLGENNDVTMRDASNNENADPIPSTSRAESVDFTSRSVPTASTSSAAATVSSGVEPIPSTSRVEPIPSTSRAEPVPSTSRAAPTVTSGAEPIPSTSRAEPIPSTSRAEPVPSTSRAAPTVTSGAEPVPSTSRAAPTVTSGAESIPSTSRAESIPPTSRAEPVPSTSSVGATSSSSEPPVGTSTTQSVVPAARTELNNNLPEGNTAGRIPREFLQGLDKIPQENLDKFWSQAVYLTILYS